MTWKFLFSAILIVGAMILGYDMLQPSALNLSEVPLGAYPIPFANGVKEALIDMSEDSNRSFTTKLSASFSPVFPQFFRRKGVAGHGIVQP